MINTVAPYFVLCVLIPLVTAQGKWVTLGKNIILNLDLELEPSEHNFGNYLGQLAENFGTSTLKQL